MPNDRASRPKPPALTPEGRKNLEAQSRQLLDRLRGFEGSDAGDPEVAERYESLLREFVQLSHLIHSSSSVEDVPDDPEVVLLGDEVVLSSGVGRVEHYLIVHPLEAGLDAGRISSDSPLGAAVLGQSVGQRVVVPGTGKEVTILAASRKRTPT